MRAPLPLALLAVAAGGYAQTTVPVTPAKAVTSLKDAMVVELGDPKTQVAIGVTPTQRYMMEVRLAENSVGTSLDLVKAALQANDAQGAMAFSTTFTSTPAKALYPYLAANQLAKLRRLTLVHQPLVALGTEEVAFALTLTEAQRAKIEAIRAAQAKAAADPNRPSIRFLTAAMTELAKEAAKVGEESPGGGVSVESVDAMRPYFTKVFRALEAGARLSAKEPVVKTPDPLLLLTPAQRRRYKELSISAVALAPRAEKGKD